MNCTKELDDGQVCPHILTCKVRVSSDHFFFYCNKPLMDHVNEVAIIPKQPHCYNDQFPTPRQWLCGYQVRDLEDMEI